jgi:UDP-N-acetyl-2-amino-2-deoxyglucuronate dehydrogenase
LAIKEKVKAAIIGCGKVGHTHAQGYQRLPESELAAVCDVSLERAEAYGKTYHVKGYNDFDLMLHENQIDVLSICTPHPLHAETIQRAAAHGVHVLTEKPLASDLSDCDLAIDACRQNHVKLGVISQRRFYPPIQRMKTAIAAGKIGQPIIGDLVVLGWRDEAYYAMDAWRGKWQAEGGGVLVNQTIHQLDLLVWLMGPIDELFGYWDNFNHPYIEVDDTAAALMRFKSGAIGQILVSNSQKPGFYGKIHIHGSNGASVGAQTEGGSPFVAGLTTKVDPPINDMWTIQGDESLLETWQEEDRQNAEKIDTMTYYHQLQIEDFIHAVIEDREPAVTGEAAREAVELFTGIYRSQRDHQPIQFPLKAESDKDFDGRVSHTLFSHREVAAP